MISVTNQRSHHFQGDHGPCQGKEYDINIRPDLLHNPHKIIPVHRIIGHQETSYNTDQQWFNM